MSEQKNKEYVGENTFEVYVISELKVIRKMVETTQKQVEDLNKDLKARTIQNGHQDVSLAKLSTTVDTHEKAINDLEKETKKLSWKVGLIVGSITVVINFIASNFF